jgi:hypothetical protein
MRRECSTYGRGKTEGKTLTEDPNWETLNYIKMHIRKPGNQDEVRFVCRPM